MKKKKVAAKRIARKIAKLHDAGQMVNRAGKVAFKSGKPYARDIDPRVVGDFEMT